MKEQAKALVVSGFLPKAVDTPQKAVAIIMMAKELGIGPMEGLSKISVIQGKPTIPPEMMKALVHKKLPKAIIRIVKSDSEECVIHAARPGEEITEFRYTMNDAKKMDLASKSNWQKQPKVMLKWRCIGDVCRTVFPDCLSGASYSPEEIDPNIQMDETGQIIDVKESPKADVIKIDTPPLARFEVPKEIAPPEAPIEVIINEGKEASKEEKDDKQKDRRKMYSMMTKRGWSKEQVQDVMMRCYGTDKTTFLKSEDLKALLAVIEHQSYEEALRDIL